MMIYGVNNIDSLSTQLVSIFREFLGAGSVTAVMMPHQQRQANRQNYVFIGDIMKVTNGRMKSMKNAIIEAGLLKNVFADRLHNRRLKQRIDALIRDRNQLIRQQDLVGQVAPVLAPPVPSLQQSYDENGIWAACTNMTYWFEIGAELGQGGVSVYLTRYI